MEAVGGNGIANLLDSEVGDLELVTIGVKHLGTLLLVLSHGGQRGRRG